MPIRPTSCLALAAMALAAAMPAAGDTVFTSNLATFELDGRGCVTAIRENETGRDLLRARQPFAFMCDPSRTRSVWPTKMTALGKDRYSMSFQDRPGELVFAIKSFGPGWAVKVEKFTVPTNTFGWCCFAHFAPKCNAYSGHMLNMLSDDESCVVVRALDTKLGMSSYGGVVRTITMDAWKDFTGAKAAIVIAPRKDVIPALRKLTEKAGIPVQKTGGAWSMGSAQNRRSTVFAEVSEESADEWVDFAERGGFGIVHLEYWWTTLGHYLPVRKVLFPNGIDGMKAVCAKFRAAGITPGTHTLAAEISTRDPWVHERTEELERWCSYTLAKSISTNDTEVCVNEIPWDRHDTVLTYTSRGNVLRIGRELMQYTGVSREKPYRFTGVTRGAFGTAPATAAAGAAVDYIQQAFIGFFPRRGTMLMDDVAKQIAHIYRECNLGDVYYDGVDGIIDIPSKADFRLRTTKYINNPDGIIESAGFTPHAWWHHSRGGAWDHPRWGSKRFHDWHVIAAELYRKADLLEGQVGWWQPRVADANARGHFLDEMEYFASRNAGSDIVGTIQGINIHRGPLPETVDRQITLFGWYERFRRARAFRREAVAAMSVPGAEFRLRQADDGRWMLRPSTSWVHRVSNSEANAAKWKVVSPGRREASLRVEALYAAAKDEGDAGIDLCPGARLVSKPGDAIVSVTNDFKAPYFSLDGRTAFGFRVKGDGKGELLNFQVSSPREYHNAVSDHYIRVDWTGWRYVTVLLRERDVWRMDEFKWPYKSCPGPGGMASHPMFRNPIDGKHISSVRFYLNCLPADSAAEVEIGPVRALRAEKTRQSHPAVVVNGGRFEVPFELESGEYAELEGATWRRYAENGDYLGKGIAKTVPSLKAGDNEISYEAAEAAKSEGGGRAEVTVFALGEPFPALDAFVMAGREALLGYEGVMPLVHRPSAGIVGETTVITRPGENAVLGVSITGPIDTPSLGIGGKVRTFPVKIGANERLRCRDGRNWILYKCTSPRREIAKGTLDQPMPEICGAVTVTVSSRDPETAFARVNMEKRYTGAAK